MNKVTQITLQRIDRLVTTAESFQGALSVQQKTGREDLWRFLVSAMQTVRSICTESSPHYQELKDVRDFFVKTEIFQLPKCIGTLRAAADDLREGMLSNMRELIEAEVFDDLIELAIYLLEQGYHLPSVAIAGAVLEDTLRKVAEKHSVGWSGDSAISKINTELYKANVYDKVQHGQVDTWGKLRNKVDHGDFRNSNEIDRNDARRMLDGLRDFIVKFLR